jgi:3D (Asp-Asp-Asp) domain-containing protein
MHKGIKTVTIVALTFGLLGFNSPTVGQEKVEYTENPQKHLSLTQKELPPTFTTQKEVKAVKTANTEGTTPSKPKPNYRELTVEATAYVSYCNTGCIGITKTGTDVRNKITHDETGLPIIAVDPSVIPLGSKVEINGKKYIADDTGGAIKGNRIDILVATTDTSKAFDFGRQTLSVKVYN